MKYRVEYESAKDGLVHTQDIEGDSDKIVLKKLVEKYKAEPTKILSCRRIKEMKIKDSSLTFSKDNAWVDRKARFMADKFNLKLETSSSGAQTFIGNRKDLEAFVEYYFMPGSQNRVKSMIKDSVSRKTYKIGNRTINADSIEEAIRVNKMLDSTVGDISESDILRKIDHYERGMKVSNPNEFQAVRKIVEKKGVGAEYDPRTGYVKFIYDSVKDEINYDSRLFHAGSDVRALCIKHDWYTGGTNSEYARMLQGANDGWTIAEIAKDIAEHSHGVWTNDVAKELRRMAEDKTYLLKRDSTCEDDDYINGLSEEEKKAIEDYRKAIAGTNDPKLLQLYAHILKEEVEHLEELKNASIEEPVEDMADMPEGYPPVVKTKKIITWKNAIKPDVLKMLIEKYKSASGSDKDVLSAKIKRYAEDVLSDYKADLGNSDVSREEVERHYSSYKNAMEEINRELKTGYRF